MAEILNKKPLTHKEAFGISYTDSLAKQRRSGDYIDSEGNAHLAGENNNQEHDACGVNGVIDLRKISTPSHDNTENMIKELIGNKHRTGVIPGSDGKPIGDGNGVAFSIPIELYQKKLKDNGVDEVIEQDRFGVGNFLFPANKDALVKGKTPEQVVDDICKSDPRIKVLKWIDTDIDPEGSDLSVDIKNTLPKYRQVLFKLSDDVKTTESLKVSEDLLIKISHAFRDFNKTAAKNESVYPMSFGTVNIDYKGNFMPEQIPMFFKDLKNSLTKITRYIVHGRFSTGQDPDHERSQTFNEASFSAGHNGDLLTNMKSQLERASILLEKHDGVGIDASRSSDSGNAFAYIFDKVHNDGLSLAAATKAILQPSAEQDEKMGIDEKAFYRYHSLTTSPANGPAHFVLMGKELIKGDNGEDKLADVLIATKDNVGLRPSVYTITVDKNGDPVKFYIGSEHQHSEEELRKRGEYIYDRGILKSGEMIMVRDGVIYKDKEIMEEITNPAKNGGIDYAERILDQLVSLPKKNLNEWQPEQHDLDWTTRAKMAMWDRDIIRYYFKEAIKTGEMPSKAMGDSQQNSAFDIATPNSIHSYFKEMFAQVINPPVDTIREEKSVSYKTEILPNELDQGSKNQKIIEVDHPFLRPGELRGIKEYIGKGAATIDITFDASDLNQKHFRKNYNNAIEKICKQAEEAVLNGARLIVLSDVGVSLKKQGISDLEVLNNVDNHLREKGLRLKTKICLQSGQIQESASASSALANGADFVDQHLIHELIYNEYKSDSELSKKYSFADVYDKYHKVEKKGLNSTMGAYGFTHVRSFIGSKAVHLNMVDTSDGKFAKTFAAYESEIGGINQDHLIRDHMYAHFNAVESLKNYEKLLGTFLNIFKNVGIDNVEESLGNSKAYGYFADNHDKMLSFVRIGNPAQLERKDIDSQVEIVREAMVDILLAKKLIKNPEEPNIGDEEERARNVALKDVVKKLDAQIMDNLLQMYDEIKVSGGKAADLDSHGKFQAVKGGKPGRFDNVVIGEFNKMMLNLEAKKTDEYIDSGRNSKGIISDDFINSHKASDEYLKFSDTIQKHFESSPIGVRDLITFRNTSLKTKPIDVSDVEHSVLDFVAGSKDGSVQGIRTGQMSLGALTPQAHGFLSKVFGEIGESNYPAHASGEGGVKRETAGTRLGPKDVQLASGGFNNASDVFAAIAKNAGEVQIKIVQGAKPGRGGKLGGLKVSVDVAALRQILPGMDIPSPAPIEDIFSVEDLKGLVKYLKSYGIKIDIKIGAEAGCDTVAAAAAKCGANKITLCGHEGGTGNAGVLEARKTGDELMVWGEKCRKKLDKFGFGDVPLVADGGVVDHKDAVKLMAHGFDGISLGTMAMVMEDCRKADVCNVRGVTEKDLNRFVENHKKANNGAMPSREAIDKNFENVTKCPVGVANSGWLFEADKWKAQSYLVDFASALKQTFADLGVKNIKELRENRKGIFHYRQPSKVMHGFLGKLNFSNLMEYVKPRVVPENFKEYMAKEDVHPDDKFIPEIEKYLKELSKGYKKAEKLGEKYLSQFIENIKPLKIGSTENPRILNQRDECFGTKISALVTQYLSNGRYSMDTFPDRMNIGEKSDIIQIFTAGTPGQRAFAGCCDGITFIHQGSVHDTTGRNQLGGVIAIKPEKTFFDHVGDAVKKLANKVIYKGGNKLPDEHGRYSIATAGNTGGYAQQGGNKYIDGNVGEREGICAHGGVTVANGCGDFFKEFASSGVGILLTDHYGSGLMNGATNTFLAVPNKDKFEKSVNKADVAILGAEHRESCEKLLHEQIKKHFEYTGSKESKHILDNFDEIKKDYVFAVPKAIEKDLSYKGFKEWIEDIKSYYDARFTKAPDAEVNTTLKVVGEKAQYLGSKIGQILSGIALNAENKARG